MDQRPRIWALVSLLIVAAGACTRQDEQPEGPGATAGARVTSFVHIHGLGVDAQGTLFVATHAGLIRRTNAGWSYAGADRNDHMGFTLHPGAGVMYRSGHSVEQPSLGVQSSTDGETWTQRATITAPPVDFHAMAVSFADPKTLWGWDSGGRGTFRSRDGGTQWSRLDPRGIDRRILVLAGPAERDVVLAGTPEGLFRSTDAGDTWRRVDGAATGFVIAIGADPDDAARVMAFTNDGLRLTGDGGRSWKSIGDLPEGAEIIALAFDPTEPRTVYAADAGRVFVSENAGETWSLLPAPTG